MSNLEPGVVLKEGVFSAWKTSESIRSIKDFDPLSQINITNQPTWYTHILIKSWKDLVAILKDIYAYNIYYVWYAEKKEYYDILVNASKHYKKYSIFESFPHARNIKVEKSFFKNWILKKKIALWLIPVCNLEIWQVEKEIILIETYFEKRKIITEKYWEDLIPDFFNVMILDELHLYFWTRNYAKNFQGENSFLMDILAFPVKLNLRLEWIAQNVNALDIIFRRQCSLYIKHFSTFFGLMKVTRTYDIPDPEHPVFNEETEVHKDRKINWYKLFGLPKLQYYRRHIINASDENSIYNEGDYFNYIRSITDSVKKEENKQNKDKKWEKKQINENTSWLFKSVEIPLEVSQETSKKLTLEEKLKQWI